MTEIKNKLNKDTKEKVHKKSKKSYVRRVVSSKKEHSKLFIVFALLFAFILDALRLVKNFILWLIAIGLVAGTVLAIVLWIKIEPVYTEYNNMATEMVDNSTYDSFKLTESSFIYDKDGDLIAKLRASEDSEYLSYNDIPSTIVDAFVAVEDRTFWENSGIDIKGIIRVLVDYVNTSGEEAHGASTITQQLARNIFLTHEVSIERKAKEILIALKLTDKYTKEDIMEFYCNDICFANAYYGVQSASKGYFGKEVSELSLSQMAYLCAIPNSPEYYNPYKNPERAITRRDKILGDMYELELISKKEYEQALNEEIVITKASYPFEDYMTTYAVDCAVRYIMELDGFEFKYGIKDRDEYTTYMDEYSVSYENARNKLYTGGYKVYTSLDQYVQYSLQKVLDEQLSFDDEINQATGSYALQGSISVFDNDMGKIIAVIGGRSQDIDSDSESYSFNRAFQSYRQPGSTIKPLVVYTPALMNGYNPNSTVYNIDVTKAKEKGVDVQALTGTSMTLRSALEQSRNGVAWQLFDKFGAEYCMEFMNKMQFSNICPDDYYNSSSLGGLTYGVSTVEMSAAYATLENHGYYREATCIMSIIDRYGKEIYKSADSKQVYGVEASDTMVDLMTGVLKVGTASRLRWGSISDMAAAAKTGTTNNSKDGWLCGFTPYYTVSVWIGYDQPREMNNLYGSTYPGQVWKDSMLRLIAGKTIIEEFETADDSLYGELDEEGSTITMATDLPEHAYTDYMVGREDSEVLSDGYTVYDFRKDRIIGESVEAVIANINSLNVGDQQLETLYSQGCEIISTIYSRRYTGEMQTRLDEAYNSKK